VIVRYVGLAFWPRPLVFDYGPELLVHGIASVWPFVVLVLGALLGTVLAWRWSKAGGFLAASFFVLLAPTSSFVPILTQPMAENRLYLPLAAVIAMLVLAAARLLGVRAMVGFAAVTVVFAALSFARNRTYATEIGLWEDSLKVEPLNFRGHTALGDALAKTGGRRAEAVVQYREVIRLNPDDAVAHCNLGTTLALMPGGRSEAIEQFRETLRLRPNNSLARRNLATVLAKSRETLSEAAEQFEAVLKANPDDAVTHYDLANVFTRIPGKMPNAISEYKAALKTNPDFLEAHTGLSYVYFRIPGMMPEAIEQLKILVRLRPNDITSKYRLGLAYYFLGDLQKAIDEWNAVLRQNPNFEQARNSLAYVDKQRKGILVDGAIPQ